jgi:hypothetical protein
VSHISFISSAYSSKGGMDDLVTKIFLSINSSLISLILLKQFSVQSNNMVLNIPHGLRWHVVDLPS